VPGPRDTRKEYALPVQQHDVNEREQEAFAAFAVAYPTYATTSLLDDLRAREFARLDRLGHAYLDYTGSGLYAESQVRRHAELLLAEVFGNPHSLSPTSRASTERLERCRARVLRFFAADPADYTVVFTANASQALKLLGESYPFEPGDRLTLTFDNHNSVNGLREFARARGAITQYVPVFPPDLRVPDHAMEAALGATPEGARHRLFAFPAQSNFSGVQHPLAWVGRAQAHGYDVLMDAAAFVPTNRLDLSRVKPEFVALSFYKMLGYPTGVGALIARHDALLRLKRPWFAGGTIDVVSVQADQFRRAAAPAGFEDGTPDFLALPAVEAGLDFLDGIGLDLVHERVRVLTSWLLAQLEALTHGNARPLVRLYGPESTTARGGTIAFNLADPHGALVDHRVVDERAAAEGISLRTGCFCNPGAGELAFGLSRGEIAACLERAPRRLSYDEFRSCIDPKAAGAVRVSLGLASDFRDVWRLVELLQRFRR
jgi:molybdenum cofactor sulfurtransferase